MTRLFISFSGGETSAFMTYKILKEFRFLYDEIVVGFANTGQETEQCLDFVKKCDDFFGFNTVWVEGVVHEGRKGTTHKVVNYESCDRKGKIFEEVIRKYGIPNQSYPHCNRELKLQPITSYLRSIGWKSGTYDTAIGIRRDEIDRMNENWKENNLVYPLIQWFPTTKKQINAWFREQPFRLDLKGYEGNCKWCWKKTKRKHFTLIQQNPSIYDFPKEMERKYPYVGSEFRKGDEHLFDLFRKGYKRKFFRGNLSTEELFAEYEKAKNSFTPYHDEAQVYDVELDASGGCGESCDIFTDY